MPKTKRKRLVAKLDQLFSVAVRMRDRRLNNGRCRICNVRPIEVCYHLIPRGRYATRWFLDAAVGSCSPCNFGEKMHRLLYRQKHIDLFGKEFYEALELKGRSLARFGIGDLEAIKADLEKKLSGVLND